MLQFSIIAFIAFIVIIILLALNSFPNKEREIKKILAISAILVLIFCIIYPNFVRRSGYTGCTSLIEFEAEQIHAAIASYFAEPDHTNLPTINDLVQYEGYTPPIKKNSWSNNLKASDLIVFTRKTTNDEIEIWVVAGKGICRSGVAYVEKMGDESGEWFQSYEEK